MSRGVSCGRGLCRVLNRIYPIPLRVVCVVVLIGQACLLDQYLVRYIDTVWVFWTIFDTVVVALFTASFVLSYRQLSIRRPGDVSTVDDFVGDEPNKNLVRLLGGELPLAYIGWVVYSVGLAAKISVIYGPGYRIVDNLNVQMSLGLNTLRSSVSVTGIVFFLLVSTHHDAPAASERQAFMESVGATVAIDILDAAALLDLIVATLSHTLVTYDIQVAVIGVVGSNLVLPAILLIALSHSRYGRKTALLRRLRILHRVVYFLLVNLPILVLRAVVWQKHDRNTSVFIIKNAFGVAVALRELIAQLMAAAAVRQARSEQRQLATTMELTTVKPQTTDDV